VIGPLGPAPQARGNARPSDTWEGSARVFETERLVVRRLRPDDLDDFAALTGDPEIVRYMGDGQPLSRELTRQWIDVSLANYRERGWGCFGVTTKDEDRLIGFAGFARPPGRPGIVELIYAFAPAHWGRGYATEVAAALVAFGFDQCDMTRIEATVFPANEGSKRVLAKIGMAYAGRKADHDGAFVDLFALDRDAALAS
jgi:RimJ/RimL family protein N-acetyltransferase